MIKRLFIWFLIVMLGSPCLAQEQPRAEDVFYVLDDFSGMLSSHVSDYLTAKKYAQEALNVRPNETFGVLSKRPINFLLTTAPTSAVKSLYRYYKSDDTKYTVATYGTYLSYFDESGTETKLYQTASDSKRWSFVTYKDVMIGMNGTDNAKKWDGKVQTTVNTDGSRTDGDLVADLGAPFAEIDDGSGGNDLDAEAWYQYKIAFYDGTNYTYSLARSNPIKTGTSGTSNVYLTDIPLGPAGTTERYIYRTVGNASRVAVVADNSFYKVATISDNSTRVYADAIADGTITGDAAPTWATVSAGVSVTPPKARFTEINNERLFVANDPSGTISGKSTIYWSDVLNPDYFYIGTDYELIRPDDGDEITFIKNLLGTLTVGKARSISKFYTTATDQANWSVSDPYSTVGCVAPYSVVNSPSGIIYLGRYGIYVFNGQGSQFISDNVTDKIRDILATNTAESAGIYHDNRYLLSYTSSETDSSNNDRVLILDVEHNSYYIDTISVDSFAAFDSGDDFGTLYSGSSEADGNIYAHKNEFNRLVYRYKSQIQETTSDSLVSATGDSIYVGGVEDNPWVVIADDETWAASTGTWDASGSETWMMDDLTGEWYSPIVNVGATEYDKIYWNESLGSGGDITFAVRSGATTSDTIAASWSSEYSDPSGSDISALTANDYIQLRASLSSTSYTETPTLFLSDSFVIKMTYKKEGTTGESSILSVWESGETDFNGGDFPKRIKEVQVYYDGTAGTLNIKFENETGYTQDFDIDLSVDPDDSTEDQYFGKDGKKIYVHFPSFDDVPVGRFWRITVSENGVDPWDIFRISVRADVNQYITIK